LYTGRLSINRWPVRCFTLLLTLHLFTALNLVYYSSCMAEEDDSPVGTWSNQPVGKYSDHNADARFAPGSAVQVTIWQEPDLSGSFSIDSEGYVILPLIGKVKVG